MSLINGTITHTMDKIEAGIHYIIGEIYLPDGEYIINANIVATPKTKAGVTGFTLYLSDDENNDSKLIGQSTASDNIIYTGVCLTNIVTGGKRVYLRVFSGSDVKINILQFIACEISKI